MPVVAAAVVPHSPLLLPNVSKEHASLLSLTTKTLGDIAAEIYAAKPDALVILTPHGPTSSETVIIQADEHYRATFQEFGDIQTVVEACSSLELTHGLRTAAESEHLAVQQQTFEILDYGTAVPLLTLLKPQPKLPIIPILVPTQYDVILRTAAVLHDFFTSVRSRIIIVASADFSRRRTTAAHSLVKQRPTPEERTISSAIVAVDPTQLSSLQPHASTCGYTPTLALLATLQSIAVAGTIRSFEAPLGVGMLTATFTIHA